MKSPHCALLAMMVAVQVAPSQPSQKMGLAPSSHSSVPFQRNPSPQEAGTQPFRQASLLLEFPSSQGSLPATIPSPQVVLQRLGVFEQLQPASV